jgi:hypothetical protein
MNSWDSPEEILLVQSEIEYWLETLANRKGRARSMALLLAYHHLATTGSLHADVAREEVEQALAALAAVKPDEVWYPQAWNLKTREAVYQKLADLSAKQLPNAMKVLSRLLNSCYEKKGLTGGYGRISVSSAGRFSFKPAPRFGQGEWSITIKVVATTRGSPEVTIRLCQQCE